MKTKKIDRMKSFLRTLDALIRPSTRTEIISEIEKNSTWKYTVSDCQNDITRLKKIELIQTNSLVNRCTTYSLSKRGHAALMNGFVNTEYLYPHSKHRVDCVLVDTTPANSHSHIENARLYRLFFSVTKERRASYLC